MSKKYLPHEPGSSLLSVMRNAWSFCWCISPMKVLTYGLAVQVALVRSLPTPEPPISLTDENPCLGSVSGCGYEQRINSGVLGWQTSSAVAVTNQSGWVVVWQSETSSLSVADGGVRGQYYNAMGQKIGGEFRVDETGLGSQKYSPNIVALPEGGVIVAWVSPQQSSSRILVNDIYARHYDEAGDAIGAEFRVNDHNLDYTLLPSAPAMSAFEGGAFVVAWEGEPKYADNRTDQYEIYGKIFNSTAVRVGEEFRVNADISGVQRSPAVATLSEQQFVVVWATSNPATHVTGIQAQLYNISAQPINDNFFIHRSINGTYRQPAVSSLSSGGFVVAWEYAEEAGDLGDIYVQFYNAEIEPEGGSWRVNDYTSNHQAAVKIGVMKDDSVLLVWQSYGQDGSANGVYAQQFNSARQLIKPEFQINTYTGDSQELPGIAVLPNDDVLTVWSGFGSGDDKGIYGQYWVAPFYTRDFFLRAIPFKGSDLNLGADFSGKKNQVRVVGCAQEGFMVVWLNEDVAHSGIYAQMHYLPNYHRSPLFHVSQKAPYGSSTPISVTALVNGDIVVAWSAYRSTGFGFRSAIYAGFYNRTQQAFSSSSKACTAVK